MAHGGTDPRHPGWRRDYAYNEASLLGPGQSNRLSATTLHPAGSQPELEPYAHDAHGNMTTMSQLRVMRWDFKDQLVMTQRQAVNAADEDGRQRQGERTYYVYDAAGERVRKVTELPTGRIKDERIYLGGFEIYRRHGRNAVVRETLHIMDGQRRIALVETRTDGDERGVPEQHIRYQLGNHLGSAVPGARRRRRHHLVRGVLPLRLHLVPGEPQRNRGPQPLPLHLQGARRGERPLLPRRPLLRALAGPMDGCRSARG